MKSVLQDWVMELPLKQQATLISALRGPDGLAKGSAGKILCRYLRNLVLIPANSNWMDDPNESFFRVEGDIDAYIKSFTSNHDEYPHHFMMHLIHAFEIVGYNYNDKLQTEKTEYEHRERCFQFYEKMCIAFHMAIETKEEMNNRLCI